MNMTIDIGNSRTKIGLFEGRELVHTTVGTVQNSLKSIVELSRKFPVEDSIVSSVGIKADQLVKEVSSFCDCLLLSSDTSLPFVNEYATPLTLGKDRIAVVAGTQSLCDNEDSLTIDAGTCITYDYLKDNIWYKGGGISPGIHMRLKAMHHFTKRLPLVNIPQDPVLIGRSTQECLQSGAACGTAAEIDGIIRQYQSLSPRLKVWITGGDATYLANLCKSQIFVDAFLVLKGLNEILKYHRAQAI